jgi:SAM-dependent methyltransferase
VAEDLQVDPGALREQVRDKYREVAVDPGAGFHFHTGRDLARRLGYPAGAVDALPDRAVESFAGVANPFSLRRLTPGEKVVDVGSGAGFDSFIAAGQAGPGGQVVGVDMTAEMIGKALSKHQGRRPANVTCEEIVEFAMKGGVVLRFIISRNQQVNGVHQRFGDEPSAVRSKVPPRIGLSI